MDEVGHVRKRDGAWRWHLFQDTADAEHWYEAFTVASWLHYLRQRRRGTAADSRGLRTRIDRIHDAEVRGRCDTGLVKLCLLKHLAGDDAVDRDVIDQQ